MDTSCVGNRKRRRRKCKRVGCILIRYLQPRDVYAEICTRRKAYETRGISCCAPFVYAGNGFLASRPSPPCAPRPGYRALFIRYERYTEYSKHGGARRYVQLRITFFSFVYTYICMYEIYMYICMYEKKRVTLDHWTIQKRNKDGKFHRGRPKKGRDVR